MAFEYEREEHRCAVAAMSELERAEFEPRTLAEQIDDDYINFEEEDAE